MAPSHVCWWSQWGPGTSRWWHCQSLTGSAAPSLDVSSAGGEEESHHYFSDSNLGRSPDGRWLWLRTSMTCFLLDLSLEAQSTAPPLRSTVNSGFDWLPPNFWKQQKHMRVWQRRYNRHICVKSKKLSCEFPPHTKRKSIVSCCYLYIALINSLMVGYLIHKMVLKI